LNLPEDYGQPQRQPGFVSADVHPHADNTWVPHAALVAGQWIAACIDCKEVVTGVDGGAK